LKAFSEFRYVLTKAAESSLNYALKYDPGTVAKMEPLDGKILALKSESPEIALYLSCQSGQVEIQSQCDRSPNCCLEGPLTDMLELMWSGQESLADSEVKINGEVAVLLQFKQLIAGLDIDWEQPLHQHFGDYLAYPIAKVIKGSNRWGNEQIKKSPQWLSDTLTNELQLIPHKSEIQGFSAEVNQLRSDLDRLEARIKTRFPQVKGVHD